MMIVSCDEHTTPPTETYRQYFPARFHERLDEWERASGWFFEQLWQLAHIRPHQFDVADNDGALAGGGLMGAYDPVRRLEMMDREGVVLGITNPNANDTRRFHFPPFPGGWADFAANFGTWTPEEQMAGARAHNRWLADFRDATDGRVEGCANAGPFVDMDETIVELEWLAAHDFKVITIPVPPLDERYERFWAACQEFGLVLNAHAGHAGTGAITKLTDLRPSLPEGQVEAALTRARQAAERAGRDPSTMSKDELLSLLADRTSPSVDFCTVDGEVLADANGASPFDLVITDRGPLWQLMLTGVLDRYPRLKIAFSEIRSDWVPETLGYLEKRIPELAPSLQLRPTEYWERNFRIAASFMRPLEVQMRHETGLQQLMFSRDYPHPEGTWPNTYDWIRGAFKGVPEDEARAILADNAIEWFGFDRAKLEKIAARIGPQPEELLGDHEVPAHKLEYFQLTSNYFRPRIEVNPAQIEDEIVNRPAGEFIPAAGQGSSLMLG